MTASSGRVAPAILAVLLLVGLLPYGFCAHAAGWQGITPQRVQSLFQGGSGFWLMDIRGNLAYENCHAEGAVSIPPGLLAAKRFPKQKLIVLLDDSLGMKSAREAAETLLKNGQDNVFILEGGMPAWQAEKLPTVRRHAGRDFRSVAMEDVLWAQQQKVPLRILDLRDADERAKGPVADSEAIRGRDVRQRLAAVAARLRRHDGGDVTRQLEKPATTILVFPLAEDAKALLGRYALQIVDDVRYLEGGVVAWSANPGKKGAAVACPVCSAVGTAGGNWK